ncbi:transcription initiation factor TFIID subunit 9B [Capronia coronata CBS 617.96]|uniref:Transcription initiation factor TFIID subunit 9B n=1 Tax=Capronia coronata CBS 617.96 TaxID=1182541 RepID=W9YFR3_9EURO|nr:transcription initiation factor TFIID subunit 9B [Capronia coronata CBS 617.96]EXJ88101.1 transcription initiation factor TFIID subunit 9B [Capronia coronata CBS 617.96]
MSSPANPSGPLTPPAEPSSQTAQPSQPSQTTAQPQIEALLSQPLTSLSDDGSSKRPRDHRLIHLLLASHGISAYQQRVPLQLMDFAYRYTNSVLTDALHIQNEAYDQADTGTSTKGRGAKQNQAKAEEGDVSLAALRMSIGSRVGHQFQGSLPKEFLKSLADEKNRISLNAPPRDNEKSGPTLGGVRLPHEKFCLTGMGWGLKDEWDSEGEESVESEQDPRPEPEDLMQMDEKGGDEDEEGMGTMEDVFGPDAAGGDGDKDEDAEMQG